LFDKETGFMGRERLTEGCQKPAQNGWHKLRLVDSAANKHKHPNSKTIELKTKTKEPL
jgi:hypothetical protein